MPSTLHETLTGMFRQRPLLAAELLADVLGVNVPHFQQARLDSVEFTEIRPTEYLADAVVVLVDEERPVLAVVVEVQLGRDEAKRFSWPVYLTTLRARLRCAAVVLVVCPDPGIARWCGAPIELGPGSRVTPLVLGPDRVPIMTDPVRAVRAPELTVLSALAHGVHPERPGMLDALLSALTSVDEEQGELYSDLVLAALPAATLHYLEALMSTGVYEPRSEFFRKYIVQPRAEARAEGLAEGRAEGRSEGRSEGRAEGRAQGRAEGVLAVLDARGITLDDATRSRIAECADVDQLGVWLRRATTARVVEDVFG